MSSWRIPQERLGNAHPPFHPTRKRADALMGHRAQACLRDNLIDRICTHQRLMQVLKSGDVVQEFGYGKA